jgi:hypothetical protein
VIDRGLSRDLRALDDLLRAEVVARPAMATDVARQLGTLAAAHRDGAEHDLPGHEDFDLPAPESPVLAAIARRFGLDAVDRLLLLLAIAVELDGRYAHVFAALNDVPGLTRPTVGLAQMLIRRRTGGELAVIDRLLPSRPLGRYGLVALEGPPGAAHRCLGAPADVLTWLADGHQTATAAPERLTLAPGVDAQVAAAAAWIRRQATWTVWVHGPPGSGRAAAARALITATGARALSRPASELATAGPAALLRAAIWADAVLLIENAEATDVASLRELASTAAPLAVTSRTGALTSLLGDPRPCLDLAIRALPTATRAEIWRDRLGDAIGSDVDPVLVAERHRIGPERIALAARRARAHADAAGTAVGRADIDLACRDLTIGQLADLGHRLDVEHASAALVLAPAAARELTLAVTWARHSRRALQRGGAALVGVPEDHLVCLFHGAAGTGKTLAARSLAERLGLEAYRIDLSQVVSKWIGETEKNLARLFDEAEAANALLFFDEADALFARRTEVKDAHDRFANIEAGYLLQRVEDHRGVVVLATNFMRNLDTALLRRCQVLVEFALPGSEQRREIWRRCLGPAADALDLDYVVNRFELSGGDIRNAALTALLLAEARGGDVAMKDVVVGTWRELAKAGRVVTREDFGPWGDAAHEYALGGR